jgi:hypothetical protein
MSHKKFGQKRWALISLPQKEAPKAFLGFQKQYR